MMRNDFMKIKPDITQALRTLDTEASEINVSHPSLFSYLSKENPGCTLPWSHKAFQLHCAEHEKESQKSTGRKYSFVSEAYLPLVNR